MSSAPDKPEIINNRKTTRQLFMYKLYHDLVQRELSELEGVPNLWKTEKYCGNKHDVDNFRRYDNLPPPQDNPHNLPDKLSDILR